jgi:hypothetical protein
MFEVEALAILFEKMQAYQAEWYDRQNPIYAR